jgi:hypothetical protein
MAVSTKGRTLRDSSKDPLANKKAFIQGRGSDGKGKPILKAVHPKVSLRMVNTRISVDLAKKLKLLCVNNDTSVQAFIREAIVEKMEREEG